MSLRESPWSKSDVLLHCPKDSVSGDGFCFWIQSLYLEHETSVLAKSSSGDDRAAAPPQSYGTVPPTRCRCLPEDDIRHSAKFSLSASPFITVMGAWMPSWILHWRQLKWGRMKRECLIFGHSLLDWNQSGNDFKTSTELQPYILYLVRTSVSDGEVMVNPEPNRPFCL